MTTQPNEAVGNDANAPVDASPADYFEQLAAEEFGIDDEEQQEEPEEGEQAEPDSAEETDDDIAAEEEVDDLPPIDAPVSWDAEAKAKFAELPRDTQEYIAKREGERERFVQTKSQEATRAKQEAEQQAAQSLAAYEAQVSQHLQTLAGQLAPQRPNPALLQHDPQAFYAQQAQYESAVAQQQELQQQAVQFAQQAQQREVRAQQEHLAKQHEVIVEKFPEFADPTTGPQWKAKLETLAKELGYSDTRIVQADAEDVLFMRNVADLKAKADKYDALQRTKMEKVRAAKGKPPVSARPGVAHGGDQLRARSADAALELARTSKNRDVQGAAFLQYLEKTGQLR